MSKLFYIFIITVVAVVKTMAQGKAVLYTTGTHFIQPVEKEQWQNSNTNTFTKASYKLYNGQTYIMMVSSKNTMVQLEYTAVVKKGKLQIEVFNAKNEVVYETTLKADTKDLEKLELKADEIYHITFTGQQTSGSYACLWKTI